MYPTACDFGIYSQEVSIAVDFQRWITLKALPWNRNTTPAAEQFQWPVHLVRGISMKATGLEEMAPPASSRKLFTDRADHNSSTTSGITLTEAAYVNGEVASHLGSFVHLADGHP